MVKNNFKLVGGGEISTRIRTGRHLCKCQARIHLLVMNCLSCGRIVCEQEGSGPCFYCGNLVCTREEREILERKDKFALNLLRKLMGRPDLKNFDAMEHPSEMNLPSLSSIAETIQSANDYKEKLLIADKNQEITKVNDLQADYFSLEQNPYLTTAEREAIIKRKEELRQLSLQAKRNILVDVDVFTGEIDEQQKQKAQSIESVNDPILQSILANSMARSFTDRNSPTADSAKNDKKRTNLVNQYEPRYQGELSRSEMKPNEVSPMFATQIYWTDK